jgi:branched-chain amino acid aminotransferase
VNTAFAKSEAVRNGYDEAIVLDEAGHAVEGSAENLFIVRDGKIITPPVTDNILEGITRKTVMTLAQDLGYDVVERSIDRTELYFADEVFLSGTGAKVSPVTEIDGYTIGDGKIGKTSLILQQEYFKTPKTIIPPRNKETKTAFVYFFISIS